MSALNHKKQNVIADTKFNGFEGIDPFPEKQSKFSATDMVNFRLLGDGSLQKRCGFAPIASCNADIRAIWSGELDGISSTFIVYGNSVALIDPLTKSIKNIGTISGSSGTASFIYFDAHLLLMDTAHFYSVTRTAIESFDAYAPLYGKDWATAKVGEVYEPLNLATRHIRMTYTVTEAFVYLRVVHVIDSIDAVYKNGVLIEDASTYYFDRNLMCVCVTGLSVGDKVELYLTIAASELNSSALFSCKQSAVYGGHTDNRLFLWGGNDPKLMYGSLEIDDEAYASCKKVYSKSLPIYIPEHAAFTMGKEGRHITAACRQYDRMLIFTNADTWMATLPSEENTAFKAITINSSHGCSVDGGAIMCENDPVCISKGTVLRWSAETDELNECNAYSISSKIDPILGNDNSFYTNAIILHDKSRAELVFSDPSDENGVLWIYNYKSSNWYKFDGIGAEMLFLCGDRLGFVKDRTVFLFDESLTYDVPSSGTKRSIRATFESHPMDLGIVGKKRLLGMTLNAELANEELLAEYVCGSETISSVAVSSSVSPSSDVSFPESVIKRLHSRRFSYVTLRFISDKEATQRIYSSEIWAKA